MDDCISKRSISNSPVFNVFKNNENQNKKVMNLVMFWLVIEDRNFDKLQLQDHLKFDQLQSQFCVPKCRNNNGVCILAVARF